MRVYRADLHVHTVLSACAGVEMIPPLIVERALKCGLDLIAITDHNASANARAVMQAAAGSHLKVWPGVELETREEVHLLCLFDALEPLARFQEQVDARLPDRLAVRAAESRWDSIGDCTGNDDAVFGPQMIVDAEGEFVAYDQRLRLIATTFTLEEAASRVHELGGCAIPAHVDRPAYGLFGHLGLFPSGLRVEAVELSPQANPAEMRRRFPSLAGLALLAGSDAHSLDQLGQARTVLHLQEEPTIAELMRACHGDSGRLVYIAEEN